MAAVVDGHEADPSGCDLVLILENWECGEDLLGWAQVLCSSEYCLLLGCCCLVGM